jgi:diguanylate cyclase (GGDEF)-like protein
MPAVLRIPGLLPMLYLMCSTRPRRQTGSPMQRTDSASARSLIRENPELLVSAGFLVLLAMLFSLVFAALLQMQSGNESMARLVQVSNSKTNAANEMRDAIRLRSNSLKTMRLTDDRFDRDEEYQQFIVHAGKYRRARETLVRLGMDEAERGVHQELATLTRQAQPWNDSAAELLMDNAPAAEVASVMQQAELLQNRILDTLDRLVHLEQAHAENALATSHEHYRSTRRLLVTLAAIALVFCLLIVRMVTQRVARKNRQLQYQASHDPLTGLINRREFEERLERAVSHASTNSATHALLYMDLDRFKIVNDTCGHAAGDELLQQLGQLLLGPVRQRDTLGRLGGDEFGMLLENCPLEKAIAIAENLLAATESFRFSWEGEHFSLGISIGIAPIDHSTGDLASAMRAADSACYLAKESGRNRIQVADMGNRHLRERHNQVQWLPRLKRALEEDRFALHFQPIVPCSGARPQGRHIEILLRMIDDDGALLSPGAFLPAAEKYNLIEDIDRRVIGRTLAWLAHESVDNHCPPRVSINLSARSIGNQETLNFILQQLEVTGVSPQQLCFEVTETAVMSNITAATGFMLTLCGHGVRFCLDDVGSGLSSFTCMKKLPVDFIKVDGGLVRDILSNPVDHAMVRAINKLGHLLGKQTIAEFVETTDVADELRKMGVDHMQGYAFAQPQSLDNYTQVMGPRLVLVS